jgi:predicted pyridoxine 5'-phosphate oxidase superfamily flavin-nucleotide-binding protein
MNASLWHEGEKQLQTHLGVRERMEEFGPKVIRDFMPDQHRGFYSQLPFIVVGAVDNEQKPWATFIEGQPGFLQSPNPQQLLINQSPLSGDPLWQQLNEKTAIGLLGIELHTRRRNRLNGLVSEKYQHGFLINVMQAFGNCPKYIQNRTWYFDHEPAAQFTGITETLPTLDNEAITLIQQADTFFVASFIDENNHRSVDVSHRGGKPGFVHIHNNTLTIPDFAGNKHFNTLGNLLINPKAGLLFVDFTNGDVLQLTGSTDLLLAGKELDAFHGAERVWQLHIQKIVRRKNLLALRWHFQDYSPYL